MTFAMVVLPTPGGPHNIMEGIFPFSTAVLRILPLPVRWFCPINWSIVFGRNRSASGILFIINLIGQF